MKIFVRDEERRDPVLRPSRKLGLDADGVAAAARELLEARTARGERGVA